MEWTKVGIGKGESRIENQERCDARCKMQDATRKGRVFAWYCGDDDVCYPDPRHANAALSSRSETLKLYSHPHELSKTPDASDILERSQCNRVP